MKILIGFTVVLFIGLILVVSYFIGQMGGFKSASRDWDLCNEYEAAGSLKKGSCECTKFLFPGFEHSYDWMDACEIKARIEKHDSIN